MNHSNVAQLFPDPPAAPAPALRGMAYIEARSIPEPNSGCWLWLGSFNRKGYGTISKQYFGEHSAHRYSLACKIGPLGGLCALHHCDNPACVNPDHLYAGTIAQNNADMVGRGRARTGGANGDLLPQAKLTPEAVRYIRANYKKRDAEFSFSAMSKRFGVSKEAVAYAYHGIWWGHVQ